MTRTYYKLVKVEPQDIRAVKNEPHIVVAKSDVPSEPVLIINQARPDWALNLMEGSVGVFNMKKLVA